MKTKKKLKKRTVSKISHMLVQCYVNETAQCGCNFNGCVSQCHC